MSVWFQKRLVDLDYARNPDLDKNNNNKMVFRMQNIAVNMALLWLIRDHQHNNDRNDN